MSSTFRTGVRVSASGKEAVEVSCLCFLSKQGQDMQELGSCRTISHVCVQTNYTHLGLVECKADHVLRAARPIVVCALNLVTIHVQQLDGGKALIASVMVFYDVWINAYKCV